MAEADLGLKPKSGGHEYPSRSQVSAVLALVLLPKHFCD